MRPQKGSNKKTTKQNINKYVQVEKLKKKQRKINEMRHRKMCKDKCTGVSRAEMCAVLGMC